MAVVEQGFGAPTERGALARGERPSDDIATEDVKNDIEIEVGPFGRAEQLRDIPAPDFIGPVASSSGAA